VFTSDGKVLFCQACCKSVVIQQRSQVTQHLSGSEHIAAIVGLKDWPGRKSVVGELSATISSNFPLFQQIYAKHLCPQTHPFLK
jgi:hypothetical protein